MKIDSFKTTETKQPNARAVTLLKGDMARRNLRSMGTGKDGYSNGEEHKCFGELSLSEKVFQGPNVVVNRFG